MRCRCTNKNASLQRFTKDTNDVDDNACFYSARIPLPGRGLMDSHSAPPVVQHVLLGEVVGLRAGWGPSFPYLVLSLAGLPLVPAIPAMLATDAGDGRIGGSPLGAPGASQGLRWHISH